MPFTLPAAIALPIVTGFLFAGPVLGFFVASLVAAAIVFIAIRMDGGSGAAEPADRAVRRAAARRFLGPLVIAAAAIVVIVATAGAARVIGWGMLAVAITVALSLVFLEVGYSEDRARERERRRGRGGRPVGFRRGKPPGVRG